MDDREYLHIHRPCGCEDCSSVRTALNTLYEVLNRSRVSFPLHGLYKDKHEACEALLHLLQNLHRDHKPELYTNEDDVVPEVGNLSLHSEEEAQDTQSEGREGTEPTHYSHVITYTSAFHSIIYC